jgi:hypothetical protein
MTQEWVERYTSLLPRINAHAHGTPLILCGLASCADAYLRLAQAQALFAAEPGTEPNALAQELIRRTERGLGGELFMPWPDGGSWIEKNLPISSWGLGGTGAQAAQTLATLGGRALISLEDRSERKLSVIHPDVLVADSSGLSQSITFLRLPPGTGWDQSRQTVRLESLFALLIIIWTVIRISCA